MMLAMVLLIQAMQHTSPTRKHSRYTTKLLVTNFFVSGWHMPWNSTVFSSINVGLPYDEMEVNVVQVLSMPRHMITIETFDSNQSLARRKWNVLPHSILHADFLPAEPIEMNCCAVEDAVELGVVDILNAEVEARRHIRVWETTESDFE